ncbi:MAG TPA: VanW family protein [Thermomicrobiales bacterium]|nr:VanW family protein [Thermomicrobiales bacterium]
MSTAPSPLRKVLDTASRVRPNGAVRAGRDANLAKLERIAWIAAAGILLLFVAGIVGVQLAERGQARTGVHALGVDLSGMDREQATRALTAAANEQTSQPLTLTDGDREWTITAADLGLVVDVDGIVDDALAVGHEGYGPTRLGALWRVKSDEYVVGQDRLGVDRDRLDNQLVSLATAIQQTRVDGQLDVASTGITWIAPVTGRALDTTATAGAIMDALANGATSVDLAIDEDAPPASLAQYIDARDRLQRIWDAPIEVVAADQTWTLTPDLISIHLAVASPDGDNPAKVQLDEEWLNAVVREISIGTDSTPQSARAWWGDGGRLVKTRDATSGLDLDEDAARILIKAAFSGESDANRVELPVATIAPLEQPADFGAIDVSTLLASSRTPYGGGLPERSHNIELAASLLNGALVLPGETFSFNSEIGPTTVEAGWQIAYGIAESDGQVTTVPAEAGGICQVATTVFQPVFYSGFRIDQRASHSYWIPRYAYQGNVGIDAAVESTVGLDLKWTNDGPTPVLLEVYADGEDLWVSIYGAPLPWRVEVDPPVVTNVVAADPTIYYQETDTIPPGSQRAVEHAQDGFDVTVTRRVIQGDNVITEDFSTTYTPAQNLVLVGT